MAKFGMTVEVKVNDRKIVDKTKVVLERGMRKLEEHAVRLAPVVTGNLRNLIILVKINDFMWELVSRAEYSAAVEFGTSPHLILPKAGKVLRFKKGNKTVFTTRVQHPGSSGSPYMRPALDIVDSVDLPIIINQEFGSKSQV